MAGERITTAAGGIVWRPRPSPGRPEPRVEVLLVHRPSYDDWTFPKGKTDPGELLQTTAVREIGEEAGLRVRLGHPLQDLSYPISGGTKIVSLLVRTFGRHRRRDPLRAQQGGRRDPLGARPRRPPAVDVRARPAAARHLPGTA
ncbi:NUDIX hydrolase [Aeromicrobium sp. UC242_57]|uniref:NUDIX hydrolase n=1 Tax=Aeromicrobium sp. UC242_57 TaxID=3374624 RepID=UPI003788C7EA